MLISYIVLSDSSLLGVFVPHLKTDLMIKHFGKLLDQFEPEKIPYRRVFGLRKAIMVSKWY